MRTHVYEQFFHVSWGFYFLKAIRLTVLAFDNNVSFVFAIVEVLVGVSDGLDGLPTRDRSGLVRTLRAQNVKELEKINGVGNRIVIELFECLNKHDAASFRVASEIDVDVVRPLRSPQVDIGLDRVEFVFTASVKEPNDVH